MKANIEKAIALYHQQMILGDIRELCNLTHSQMRAIELALKHELPIWKIKRVCGQVNDSMTSAEIEALLI